MKYSINIEIRIITKLLAKMMLFGYKKEKKIPIKSKKNGIHIFKNKVNRGFF